MNDAEIAVHRARMREISSFVHVYVCAFRVNGKIITMSEFIKKTPENETTPERVFWDKIITALDRLHDKTLEGDSDEFTPFDFDLVETIEGLKDENQEDALTLVFNYAIMTETPASTSTPDDIELGEFLREYGFEIEDKA